HDDPKLGVTVNHRTPVLGHLAHVGELANRLRDARYLVELREGALVQPDAHLVEQLFFILQVLVDGAPRVARGRGELVQRRTVDPPSGEDGRGRIEQRLPGALPASLRSPTLYCHPPIMTQGSNALDTKIRRRILVSCPSRKPAGPPPEQTS